MGANCAAYESLECAITAGCKNTLSLCGLQLDPTQVACCNALQPLQHEHFLKNRSAIRANFGRCSDQKLLALMFPQVARELFYVFF